MVLLSGAGALANSGAIVTLLRGVGLAKSYRQEAAALSDVSFSLDAGSTLGVIGESGSGKSTLAKLLVGLEKPDAGSILLDDVDITGVRREREQRRQIQVIFQDPLAALNPALTIQASVEDFLVVHGLGDRGARRRKALDALSLVHLSGRLAQRRPAELSGGQRQRACIARALVVNPRVLVADELTSALDVSVQGQLLNLLMELKRERELAIFLISHDMAVVRFAADEVLVLHNGVSVEYGLTSKLVTNPASEYTRTLIDAADEMSLDG
jgi:peptide/nickel transport system ATP-binding protein